MAHLVIIGSRDGLVINLDQVTQMSFDGATTTVFFSDSRVAHVPGVTLQAVAQLPQPKPEAAFRTRTRIRAFARRSPSSRAASDRS